MCACGEKSRNTGDAPTRFLHRDGDDDFDDQSRPLTVENDDQALYASYGPTAGAADTHAIVEIVKRYYAASAAGDGGSACALLSPSLVAGLGAGTPGRKDAVCAAELTPLLRRQRPRLMAEQVATMTVTAVHVNGDLGLAVIGFRHAPESTLVLAREAGKWRVDELFDSDVP
jgi:ketosteroid isomerase-like protein